MTRYGRMQRVMLRVLAVMLVASFGLAIACFAAPQPAEAGGCSSWQDTGYCCDTWWPGEQDYQWRKCIGGVYEWYEYRCNTISRCP